MGNFPNFELRSNSLVPGKIPAFTVNIIFLVLVISGLALAPLTSIKFLPTRTLPSISVYYSWPNVSSRAVEMEVTGPLEGAFATVRGVRNIRSESSRGSGWIRLEFDKTADMDAVRFEVATLIRQVYPSLPDGVSRPRLYLNRPSGRETALLTYTLNANTPASTIGRYAEDVIKRELSDIPGVYSVNVSGTVQYEWEIQFDRDLMNDLGIDQNSIRRAINNYLSSREMGQVLENVTNLGEKRINLLFRGGPEFDLDWDNISVTVVNNKVIRLTEIATPYYVEQQPNSYNRINGLNRVNLTVMAEAGANHLTVAREVKERIEAIRKNLPESFAIALAQDSTEFLKSELNKNLFRTLFSLGILLLFIYLVTLQPRYLTIVAICLISNIIIGFIFYYFLNVEIHLYSLAGITVSLGILIDNTIVMMDHLRHKKNLKVFIALLAATLTTIGALSVIFFLSENQRVDLVDFAMVVIINLSICLFIALFFVPALMEKLPLKKRSRGKFIKRQKNVVKFNRLYRRYILFGIRYRWAFIFVGILGFGIPVFWLPGNLEGERWYNNVYNSTIGSEKYTQNIKPVIDKALGGTLRLFVYHVSDRSFFTQPETTRLFVRAYLPEGSTVHQANNIMLGFENFLAGFDEIDQYHTSVSGPEYGAITIYFKPEYENTYFPYRLKNLLESKAIYSGGADFIVTGVGLGFSNRFNEQSSPQIRITGYNYEMLMQHANKLAQQLESHDRIQKVYLQSSQQEFSLDLRTEFFMEFDNEKLALSGYSVNDVYHRVSSMFIHDSGPFRGNTKQGSISMRLKSKDIGDLSIWDVSNSMIVMRGAEAIKLNELAKIERVRAPDRIFKENQQYYVTLMYNYLGPYQLATMVRDKEIEEANKKLPVGFRAFSRQQSGWRSTDSGQYKLIFLVIVIIFFICAILLESLVQPLAVILMLALSYIGVFLTFYIFQFNFDQGGYAAFLFLSGIVVNSALYILNDMNNLLKTNPSLSGLNRYIKSYNGKIIPIILTVVSTILGLTPFLVSGKTESFWFALAAGTIGGLIFSMLILIIFLPLLIRIK